MDEKTVDAEIGHILEAMSMMTPGSPEHAAAAKSLDTLVKLKELQFPKIKPDTWILVVKDIVGLGMVLNFEQLHVLTSKAFGYVFKNRV